MASLKPVQVRLLLVALAAVILVLALFARARFMDRQKMALAEEMDGLFRVTQKVVKEELDKQNAELERFAQRMAASPDDAYWQSTGTAILSDQKGILAIGYVDRALDLRWVVPSKYADSLTKTHQDLRANRPLLFNEAIEKNRMRMSDPVQVADTGRVFLAYYPMKRADGVTELMVAALHLQVLTDAVLASVVPKDFAVALMDGYTEVYSRGSRQVRSQAPEFSSSLPVGSAKWGLKMWPSAAAVEAHQTSWPQWAAWGGVVLALLVTGLALMPMPTRAESNARPVSTPAEWARRWESALKDTVKEPEQLPGKTQAALPPPERSPADLKGPLDESIPWIGAIAGVSDAVFVAEVESIAGNGLPVVYVNDSFTRAFGYSPAEVLGKPVSILHGAKTEGGTIESLRTAQTKRLPLKTQISLHTKDGKPLPGTLAMRPVTDSMGRPTHWIFMHHPDVPVEAAAPVTPAVEPAVPVPAEPTPAPVPLPEPVTQPVAAPEAQPLITDLPDLAKVRAAKLEAKPTEVIEPEPAPEPEPVVLPDVPEPDPVRQEEPEPESVAVVEEPKVEAFVEEKAEAIVEAIAAPELEPEPEPEVTEPALAAAAAAAAGAGASEVGVAGTDALEMLIESSPLAMMGCDLDGKITLWNGAAERMLGWREDELLGQTSDYLPPGFLPAVSTLKRIDRTRVFETDVTRERKDGSRVDLSIWASPLRDNQGDVFSWIVFLADISDRKGAERSLAGRESYYRSLLEANEDILAVVEADSTIRYLNPAVERVLGYPHHALIGTLGLDLVKQPEQQRAADALRRAGESERDPRQRPTPVSFDFQHRDGSFRTLELIATRMPGGETLIVNARDITARVQAKEQTGLQEQMLEQVSDAILSLDVTCHVLAANPSANRLFGWTDREVVGQALEQAFAGWMLEPTAGTVTAALLNRGGWNGELRMTRPAGGPLVLEVTISAVHNSKGERSGYFAIHRDITERKRGEEALRASEERYALAARSANDGLWDWNLVTDEIYYSPRWKAMLGYEESGIANMPDEWFMLVHPSDIQNLKALIAKHLKGQNDVLESEYRIRRKDGPYVWMQTRAQAVRDEKGRAIRMVGSQSDISEQKAVEDQLLHEAFHDALTGLPNRVLFVDRLGVLLDRARHGKNPKPFAVLFLDVDRFKYVNDSLGHLAGDEFLIEIGRRLQGCLSENDTVARHGGDEFTILLDSVPGAWAVQAACEKIQRAVAVPLNWQGQEFYSTVSIGSTISTLGYERPDEMVRDADTALYQAKSRGRGRHVAFDKTMHAEARQRLQLEADLRRALERREFKVVFQPLVALGMGPNQGRLAGFEALLRWHHPKRGILTPESFLSAAEETGLIVDIDRWVMREACGQMKAWSTEFPSAGPLHVSVNLSGQHFQQLDLAEQIRTVLKATNLNPEFLRIELTESILVKNQRAPEVFRELKEIKVQLNLDDFGTGYSSLSYLSKYPIDRLKIDRAFVKTMTGSAQASEIIRGILLIARNLRINVVAEGVETADQLEKLRTFGCEFAQGYHLSPPIDPEAATRLIASNPRW